MTHLVAHMDPREFDEWRAYYAVVAEERAKAEKQQAAKQPVASGRSRMYARGRRIR